MSKKTLTFASDFKTNNYAKRIQLVGWQCMNGFKSIEEAKKDLADRKKLTPKYGVEAYADVFMVTR